MTGYVLHYAPDNASLIVRLALEELGLPYRTTLVDRRSDGQKMPAYLALNPAGRIPVLVTPDGPIFETVAILLWLSERHGALMPRPGDPRRARALSWLSFIANTLHPAMISLFYLDRSGPASAHDAMHSAIADQARHAAALLDAAADGIGPFFDGAEPGLHDLYLGPLIRWAQIYPISRAGWLDLALYPNLARLARALEARPATLRAAEAEGLGDRPFTAPVHATPPEGSAT